MSLRTAILSEFETVAREQEKSLRPLSDDTMLLDSGLDSLCFAIIVARLEDRFDLDPFQIVTAEKFPVTFGDFVMLYENAAR
jgi:aryl carrier-like protein